MIERDEVGNFTLSQLILIIKVYRQHGFLLLSLAMRPYRPSLLANPLNGTRDPYRADEGMLLMDGQHLNVNE